MSKHQARRPPHADGPTPGRPGGSGLADHPPVAGEIGFIGLGNMGTAMAANLASAGRRVIAFSRFGHGRSEPAPWPPDVTGFHHREALELLPELLAALDVREPLLVGHSDGASIALIFAGHHPVGGLALLAPHVFVEPLTLANTPSQKNL